MFAKNIPMVITITDNNFESIINNTKEPLIIDFWAQWCGTCLNNVGPVIDTLAQELNGKAVFAKIDVDNNPKAAQTLGARSLPTIMFFKHAVMYDKLTGPVTKQLVFKKIEEQIV